MAARAAAAANEMLHTKKKISGDKLVPRRSFYIHQIISYPTKSIPHGLAQQQNR